MRCKFSDIIQLFFPETCVICENTLAYGEITVCICCRSVLPLTLFTSVPENQLEKNFFGRILLEEGTALLYYQVGNPAQKLLHQLKYKGRVDVGIFIGNWLGEIINQSDRFKRIEAIIPVPLHPKKERQRGYNQVSEFGRRISTTLDVPFIENVLIRKVFKESQTKKDRIHRMISDGIYAVEDPAALKGKHILLLDDVITSGATIEACCQALYQIPGIKISIAAMAYTV
jgi:ComF family protein